MELLEAIARHEFPRNFVEAITSETGGNPFFLREVLLHLVEEGKLEREAGRLTTRFSIEEMGIPEGVRQVIGRRLSRLSEEGNRLLAAASGCAGVFRFEIAAAVAELEEVSALDALDSALEAQLVGVTGDPEVYDFTHALIRHTLYGEMNPARQVRLHRHLAEEMERRYGAQAAEHALEIARQWHRSAVLPGAERGVVHCLIAADRAEQAAAHEEAATALRMALDLLPSNDVRRPRLLARLGLALAWSLKNEEAVRVASHAGELLAASEGSNAAADYLADGATAVYSSAFDPRGWVLAEQGLRHIGARRNLTWARLTSYDLDRRDAHNPDYRGIPLDIPERREVSHILLESWPGLIERGLSRPLTNAVAVFVSREEAIERGGSLAPVMAYWTGDYAGASLRASQDAPVALRRGQLAQAALYFATEAHCQSARGNLSASVEAFARATELAERAGNPPYLASLLQMVERNHALVFGDGPKPSLEAIQQRLAAQETLPSSPFRWAWAALLCAYEGYGQESLQALERTLPALERAPGWVMHYTQILYRMVEALWVLGRIDHAGTLERNLREKTLAPDFRYVHTDARLALARLCALTARLDEARQWFEKARRVLDEQGARPLRAISDFDEAWMETRRGRAAHRQRALALLDAARGSFESIGMPGWLRRAEELRQQLGR